jgi:hypothetical protein
MIDSKNNHRYTGSSIYPFGLLCAITYKCLFSSRKILMHLIYNLSFDCFFGFLKIKVVRRSLEDHARFRYSKSFVIISSSSCMVGIATTTSRCSSSLFDIFYYPNNPHLAKIHCTCSQMWFTHCMQSPSSWANMLKEN